MNSFGRIFRVSILGESHGQCAGMLIDGCPAGLDLNIADFEYDLDRRKGGQQKGTTPRKEDDIPIIKSGIFNNKTTGAPILILFENNNTKSADYDKSKEIPRPSHADFIAKIKFNGYADYRGGGHYSGRLTVALVSAGVIAKKLIQQIKIQAYIKSIGGETDIEKGLQKAIQAKDSIGGIVECKIENLPIGLGEHFFDSVESLISHIIFSIPAVRGIEFGTGFKSAEMFGTEHNDCIIDKDGKTATNHCGGIVGGITNGNDIIFRIAIKPTASTPKEQKSYNFTSNQIETFSIKGRHDLCIALRVPVIVEAVSAIVLVDLLLLNQKIKPII